MAYLACIYVEPRVSAHTSLRAYANSATIKLVYGGLRTVMVPATVEEFKGRSDGFGGECGTRVSESSVTSYVPYRRKWVMIFLITAPHSTKMASGRLVPMSLSTLSFHPPLCWISMSIVPSANDRLTSVSPPRRVVLLQVVLSRVALSVCEHGGHGIRSAGFRNSLPVLRYAHHKRKSGSRQVHKGHRPRPRRQLPCSDAREGSLSSVGTVGHKLLVIFSHSFVDRGTLLLRSGNFHTPTGRRIKGLIRSLHVFRNENAPVASQIPYHNIEQWKKAIGERLRYSGTELRKSIDQAGLGTVTCGLCRWRLLKMLTRISQSGEKDNGGVCRRETVFH